MNILHLSYQWPNKIYSNSGIFIKSILEHLIQNTNHNYFLFIANKIVNKEYIKEDQFTFMNYMGFLKNKGFYHIIKRLTIKRRIYIPIMGIKSISGYNAILCWWFVRSSLLNYIKKNNIEIIHAHFSNPDGFLALKINQKLGIPYVMHLHGRDVQEYNTLNRKEQEIIRRVYLAAKYVVCNSTKTKRLLKEIIGRIHNVEVISFGIEVPLTFKNTYVLHPPIKIISVSNLLRIKGIQYAIKALSKMHNEISFHYKIVGDGPMMHELKELANENSLTDRIEFLGRQNHEQVINLMKDSDIFLLPSYNEAFGIVYLEALACGCSVVGIKNQGCEDINNTGECIYLSEPEDVDSIIFVLSEILNNPEKRQKYIKTGYEVTQRDYNWKYITRKFDNLYQNIK